MNTNTAVVAKPRANKVPLRETQALAVGKETVSGLAEVFKMLADESRLMILLALSRDGEMHVSALCDLLGQSQPAVSHHLTLLRMNRLVGFRRSGKHNYYRVESTLVTELIEQLFSDAGNGAKQIQFQHFSLSYKRK